MPWEIDMSVLRRFERKCLLPLPNQEARLEIFKFNVKEDHSLSADNFSELADCTCGYSGADLLNIITEAYLKP
jgi:vacuolar protein-sorting-associated protein 4